MGQFGLLDRMQQEFDTTETRLDIRILGVNGAGLEEGNATAVAGRTIPWLQDTAEENVWVEWEVAYRDVVILDDENRPAGVLNLTTHDLHDPSNYDSLRGMLLEAAAGE